MLGKKFYLSTGLLLLTAVSAVVFAIYYFRTEEVRINTPEWLKVQVFEYEKQNKLEIEKVSKCQTKDQDQSRIIYILNFEDSTRIVLNENTTFECDTRSSKCDLSNIDKNQCLTLINK